MRISPRFSYLGYKDIISFMILVAVLLWKPRGISTGQQKETDICANTETNRLFLFFAFLLCCSAEQYDFDLFVPIEPF